MTKEDIRDNIVIKMRNHINQEQAVILDNVIKWVMRDIEVTERETLPATEDTMSGYYWELFELRKGTKLSKKTMISYRGAMESLCEYTHKSLLYIKTEDIDYYLLMKRKEGNKEVSLNNKMRKISAFYTWMRKSGYIAENPAERLENYKEEVKPIDHMTVEEYDQLKDGCKSNRDRALIEFLRCTACRDGEIPNIKIKDVIMGANEAEIMIYGEKSKKYRKVYLDQIALKFIRRYLRERGQDAESEEPLFLSKYGQAMSGSAINSNVKKIARQSGLKRRVYAHLFRKTTATNIIMRGGTEEQAGAYLGHAAQSVTGKHYSYKGEEYVHNVFQRYVKAV